MPRQCLFCPRSADSREHIWSDWILEDLKLAHSIRIRIGKHTDRYVDNPEICVNCVCQQCNGGWMSDLENGNKPHMRAMMHDQPIVLEPSQQKLLACWAVLKAVVIEATHRRRTPFYSAFERTGLKSPSPFLPVNTSVWIGQYSEKGFHAGGTDIWRQLDEVPKAIHGCVTSIIVGHLVIQVLTRHVHPKFVNRAFNVDCKPGAWNTNLLEIWPIFGAVHWPPPVSFAPKGPTSIATIINRWKVGTDLG